MSNHKIDLVIDGKKIISEGQDIHLKIDGEHIYNSKITFTQKNTPLTEIPLRTVKLFLKASDSVFSHIDRYKIVTSLVESPKTFTEIKTLLNSKSPTTNFHLKTLSDGMIVYKNENGKYALTLLGESILDYFGKILKETQITYNKLTEV